MNTIHSYTACPTSSQAIAAATRRRESLSEILGKDLARVIAAVEDEATRRFGIPGCRVTFDVTPLLQEPS